MNTAGELAGNIKLGDLEGGGMMPMMMMQGQNMLNGVLPDQPQSKNRSTLPPEFRNLDTLDEPVCETIVCTNQTTKLCYRKEIWRKFGTSYASWSTLSLPFSTTTDREKSEIVS